MDMGIMDMASFVKPDRRVSRLLAIFALAGITYAAPAAPAVPEGDFWITLTPMPTPRRLLAAAVVDGAVYTFGGCGSPCFDPPLHTSTFEETRVEVYVPNPQNRTQGSWSVRKRIPAVLFGAAAAAVGDRIYLFGGFVTGNQTYEYDPKTDTWTRKAPMPTPRHGLAAVELDGKIYVVGGSNGTAPTNAMEVYDPATDSWTRLAPMPTPRVFLAAAALDNKIYVIGGSPDCCGNGRTDVVEVYDTANRSWSRAAPLPVALQVSAAAAANGKIYVLGGYIPGSGVQGSTFEYDPDKKTWTRWIDMPDPRDQAPAVVLTEKIGDRALEIPHVLGGSVDCHCKARGTHSSYTPDTTPVSVPLADLKILNTNDPPGPVVSGQTLHYTITVTNLGPDAVSGAVVTDDLKAAGLLDVSWCPGLGCKSPISGNLRDTIDLAVQETKTYEAKGTVAPGATGTISNTAEVHPPGNPGDPISSNNHSTVTNPVVSCQVSITKTPDRSTAVAGDEIRYEITVHNDCPVASTATVTDDLGAAGLIAPQWCRDQGGCTLQPGNLDDTVELAANETVTYEAAGTVPCSCGQNRIDNTACVATPGQPESCATATVAVPPGHLTLAVTGAGDIKDCSALEYGIQVTNDGPGAACGAMLQVQPPAGSTLLLISSPCTGLPCQLGDLPPHSLTPVTVRLSVPAGLQCPASLSTTASVSGCDNAAQTVATTIPCVLAVTKTDGLQTAAPGDPILYTIGIKNQGCTAVSGAGVHDAFPAEFSKARWCRGALCVPFHQGPLVDTLDLPFGGSETYFASGTVSVMFTGTLINKVTVSPPESAPVSAKDETLIAAPPGLTALCKELSGSPFVGEEIIKTFVILNGGPAAQGDNPGPEFVDALPAGLILTSATASSGTITLGANTVSWDGAIPVDGMVTIQITATVGPVAVGTAICNGGTTQFDADGDGVNESNRPTPVPCCFVVQKVPLIPALSGPGLVVLALLLSALALARLRHRARQ